MRELVYFIAVAENMHFGRAAEQLGIAQPPLSRAISRLERRMGVQLFERTSRSVSLTKAGDVFLRESRKALAAVDGAVRRTQQAARPERLVIAVRPGTGAGLLSQVLDAYRRGPDPVPIEMLFTAALTTALRDGTADLALMCSSDDLDGLDTADLLDEGPVALLPAGHPLAARESLTAQDLRGEDRFREQCPPIALDEIVDRVAIGDLVVVIGAGTTSRLGPSVTAVPVVDMPSTRLVLAWPRAIPLAARDQLIRTAVAVATRCRRAQESADAHPALASHSPADRPLLRSG
ncbi:LysR family transcriptional regulator [Planotetraspora thailandica]|uniref:LysR family transcriptional regulator n=1 Tax=Planotetraspora thailandica TaxID=487172 RepID=A0A8J4DFH5_9ACTN|nr:LysR family transcriptional regulator [Planotetraspora thailandica]